VTWVGVTVGLLWDAELGRFGSAGSIGQTSHTPRDLGAVLALDLREIVPPCRSSQNCAQFTQ
jgi:hypothetical protein